MKRFAIAAALAACGDYRTPDVPVDIRHSVLELHGAATHAGTYVVPDLTHAAVANLHIVGTDGQLVAWAH